MTVYTLGINHQTAPLALREQLAFTAETSREALQDLISKPAINEAVLISTCNRTEIYAATTEPKMLFDWFNHRHHSAQHNFHQYCYLHQNIDAIKHLFRVTTGLDSMVLGETQISGQIKRAYQLACELNSVGSQLKPLFPAAFAASKAIRTQTAVGKHPITLAYATVQLMRQFFNQISERKILLIGAGETIELMATHLQAQGITDFIVATRNPAKSTQLCAQLQAKAITIECISEHLHDVDAIVSATASPTPIITQAIVSKRQLSAQSPLFIADLAVPRDIAPDVATLPHIELINIDTLQTVINKNLAQRKQAAEQAQALVDLHAQHYMNELRVHDVSDIIRGCREGVMAVKDEELASAIQRLNKGHNPYEVLSEFAHRLSNKMLHKPTTQIRKAAEQQRSDLVLLSKYLFDLE